MTVAVVLPFFSLASVDLAHRLAAVRAAQFTIHNDPEDRVDCLDVRNLVFQSRRDRNIVALCQTLEALYY